MAKVYTAKNGKNHRSPFSLIHCQKKGLNGSATLQKRLVMSVKNKHVLII